MTKISVIIPIYNTEKYLKQCLDSVLNNTMKDIEIICVDDGSTDNSLKVLEEYKNQDKRIKIIKQEKNLGAGNSRNVGLDSATGEFLYFLDSDDFVEINIFEKMYNKINQQHSDICLCGRKNYDEKKDFIRICKNAIVTTLIPQKDSFEPLEVKDDLFQICSIACFTKLYKTDFIRKNNLKFQELRTCNDVFFNFSTLLLSKRITYINESLVTSRRNRIDSLTSTRGAYATNIILAHKKIYEFLREKNLLSIYQTTFYKQVIKGYFFEQEYCTNWQKFKLLVEFVKFLPFNQTVLLLFNVLKVLFKKIIKTIFSLTNEDSENGKLKVITILGFKIKFKKR